MIKKLLSCFVCLSIMVSCDQLSKQVVSDEPIKSDIMGIELCSITNCTAIEKAFTEETGTSFLAQQEEIGTGSFIRLLPLGFDVYYGGASWTYIDVLLDEDSKVVYIAFVSSYESLDKAKKQFDMMREQLHQKYGKGNNQEEQFVLWTDHINSVGIHYEESSSINGNDRCFCTMYYTNIALSDAFDEANVPDI